MEFTLPDWLERTRWRLLCQAIPDFLKLYMALRALQGKKIHQTEARAIAVLYDAAVKGLDEWERKAIASGGRAATAKPLAGAQRMAKVEPPNSAAGIQSALNGYAILAVVLNGIVN